MSARRSPLECSSTECDSNTITTKASNRVTINVTQRNKLIGSWEVESLFQHVKRTLDYLDYNKWTIVNRNANKF